MSLPYTMQCSIVLAMISSSLSILITSISFCYTALCSDPVNIGNGMVTFTGNSVGDTATYSCDSGFELLGELATTCTLVDGNFAAFSPEQPFCIREYHMNV